MRPTAPLILAAAATVLAAGSLTACSSGSGSSPDTVKIAYQRSTNNKVLVMDNYLEAVKKDFEKANPGKKVKLIPIQADENAYYTKIQQMMRSSKTAPDLVYEDTFLINSDIKSGYLAPIDKYLAKWPSWDQFLPTAKTAAKAQDGKTYGVPDGTDTRGIWFNKEIFKKAGLPVDWQPKSWAEILDAARTIKQKVPGTIPLNIYTGKGPGEAAVMQGFEMLLYGTGTDPLYDTASRKWVAGSKGFKDSLGFVNTVFSEKLGPQQSDALDPNVGTQVQTDWLPNGKLAIDIDGSWMGNQWLPTGGKPWPEWSTVLGQTAMPTQNGQAPGKVSMSGGWIYSIPAKSKNQDLAWKMIEQLQTKENAVKWTVQGAQIAVRKDVAADPGYLKSSPGVDFFTGLVQYTHYRPALPVYPQISTAIGEAMEAVTTGDAKPDGAAKTYDDALKTIAGDAVVNKG
ncbi:extracellular solute-binding protein [Streptomyces beijiangensis]|uniref:Extracellular solute-binding protein n=1 Tax=Streptomyces beijiangensis TaxID=163361 RepID=A0A939F946_9ACTN|nr:extracellular solute-binding protein [Streptomyces beijiangensis]MBO0513879.1 extracellular solute-binding protein [Streptomyces beijiangensis]